MNTDLSNITGQTDGIMDEVHALRDTPETAFSYRVRATGQGGESAYSNTVAAVTGTSPIYPPTAPSGLTAIAQSQNSVSLTWEDNADDETSFEVERSQDGGLTWALVASPGANLTNYSDQGLNAETYYLYRVRALGDLEPSSYSNEAGATTNALPPPVGCSVTGAVTVKLDDKKFYWKLTNVGGVGVTINRVEISWPAKQGKLSKLRLGRDEIWRGRIASSPATVDSGWNTEESRRQMGVGETKEFRAEFKNKFKGDSPSDYSVIVYFAEGCSVKF